MVNTKHVLNVNANEYILLGFINLSVHIPIGHLLNNIDSFIN